MNSLPDPVVPSLVWPVYCQFVHDGLDGPRRPEDFDRLYCFELLARSFSHREALANAVQGRFEG